MEKRPQIDDGVSKLATGEDEIAVTRAVKQMLSAAKNLCLAADLAIEGSPIDQYINSAIRLRDLATSLSPDKPDWPENVIPFVPKCRAP